MMETNEANSQPFAFAKRTLFFAQPNPTHPNEGPFPKIHTGDRPGRPTMGVALASALAGVKVSGPSASQMFQMDPAS